MANNRRLIYKKEDGKVNPMFPSLFQEDCGGEDKTTIAAEKLGISPLYRKDEGDFSYSLLCVISGGTKKERDFLKELIKGNKLSSLRVIFVSKEGQGLHPYQMQECWNKIQNEGTLAIDGCPFKLDSFDKVFLLSDVDEFYEQLVKIKKNKSAVDMGEWIISNPCFEIWLYYCFKNNPEVDLASLKDSPISSRSQKLKNSCHSLFSGGLNPILAFEHMNEGVSNSKSHFSIDCNGIPKLYSTQMHIMAEYMMDVLNKNTNEYDVFVSAKQGFRNKMKK